MATMTDLQSTVVDPLNALRKRLYEWLSAPRAIDALPPALATLLSDGSNASIVGKVLYADVLRIICDAGYASGVLGVERKAAIDPLVGGVLRQLAQQRHDYGIAAYQKDISPFGYVCGATRWAGAVLCAKAASSTGDATFQQSYQDFMEHLASCLSDEPEQCIAGLIRTLECVAHEKPFESIDGLPSEITNVLAMKMILIRPGEFVMGRSPSDERADPVEEMQHRVRITRPFYMGAYQVTQQQYERVMGSNPSMFKGRFLPVEHLAWPEAFEFCRRLSETPEERTAGRSYRLPTEAEWEYACRAGSTTRFHVGDELGEWQAKFASPPTQYTQPTAPVGSFQPNAWGLYDMHGNVWEWTNDWFSKNYYEKSPVDDPPGPRRGKCHVLRGGSASVADYECTASMRGEAPTDGPHLSQERFAWYGDFGLRVACDVTVGVSGQRSS